MLVEPTVIVNLLKKRLRKFWDYVKPLLNFALWLYQQITCLRQ